MYVSKHFYCGVLLHNYLFGCNDTSLPHDATHSSSDRIHVKHKDTNEMLQNDCIPNIAKASFSSIITKYKRTVQC